MTSDQDYDDEAHDQAYYDQIIADLESGRLKADPTTLIRADQDPGLGARLIFEATGTTTFAEAIQVTLGRPPGPQHGGPSPVLRARVPREIKDGVRRLAASQHRRESDVVRDAIAAYLDAQPA